MRSVHRPPAVAVAPSQGRRGTPRVGSQHRPRRSAPPRRGSVGTAVAAPGRPRTPAPPSGGVWVQSGGRETLAPVSLASFWRNVRRMIDESVRHDTRMSAHDTRRPQPSWVRLRRGGEGAIERVAHPARGPLQVKHAISRELFQRVALRIPSPSPVVRVVSDKPRRISRSLQRGAIRAAGCGTTTRSARRR